MHPILKYREEGEFLLKEQRDYHGRFKVYFRIPVAQFDGLLAILEPHFKKKTTNFCELGVQGSIYIALWEVSSLVTWCEDNNLTLNTDKTKEIIVDMRKERRTHQPLFIRDLEVERVSSFKYLGVHISEDLTWTLNTTQLVKKAQQRLYFLRRLRKFGMSPKILSNFYSCVVESVLTSCIPVWYGSTTVRDRKHMQRVVKTADKIIRTPLASQQAIYHRRVHRRAASILKDPHPPTTWTVHTPTLRTEEQECEMQDFQIKELLPLSH